MVSSGFLIREDNPNFYSFETLVETREAMSNRISLSLLKPSLFLLVVFQTITSYTIPQHSAVLGAYGTTTPSAPLIDG